MNKIIAAGPVIVSEGRLLVAHDGKDDFFKIPGGKPEALETLEECVHRELKEETGYKCELIGKLSTKYLKKKPQTGEEIDIELYHFSAKIIGEIKSYESFFHNNHHVHWLPVSEIKEGKYKVAPNIEFLIEKGEI
ncbi:NUDIX hydrolase [archaeon]|nr:NUDIX hydrolase [archaeon]